MAKKKAPEGLKRAIYEAAATGADALPHLSELAEHFIRLSGGPAAVATMLLKEWESAPAGGLVRTRILDLISRVWKAGSEGQINRDDLGVLSDADLAREARHLLEGVEHAAEAQEPGVPAAPERAPGGPGADRDSAAAGAPAAAPAAGAAELAGHARHPGAADAHRASDQPPAQDPAGAGPP
jgi:hypothetical protein